MFDKINVEPMASMNSDRPRDLDLDWMYRLNLIPKIRRLRRQYRRLMWICQIVNDSNNLHWIIVRRIQ